MRRSSSSSRLGMRRSSQLLVVAMRRSSSSSRLGMRRSSQLLVVAMRRSSSSSRLGTRPSSQRRRRTPPLPAQEWLPSPMRTSPTR